MGGALGVAVISVIFFGAGTVTHAFTVCLWVLAGLTVLTGVLAQTLAPRRSRIS
jgi:hypothetical protein